MSVFSQIVKQVSQVVGKVLPTNIKEPILKAVLKQFALEAVRETEKQIKLKGPEKLKLALKLVSTAFQRRFGIPLPVDLIPDSVLESIVEEAVSKLKELGEEIKKGDVK